MMICKLHSLIDMAWKKAFYIERIPLPDYDVLYCLCASSTFELIST